MGPIYQSSQESDSKGDIEVYMVGNREELLEKIVEEIQQEADEEIAHTARLAREAKGGKRHNGL
jgi:acylphosphatase